MYHGTDDINFDLTSGNPSSGGFDVCTTDDDSVAEMYATRFGPGIVIEFDYDDAVIASEEEALEALGFDEFERGFMSTSEKFNAIDTSLPKLREAGYDAVRYEDRLPGTADSFITTRFIQPVIEECDRFAL